MNAVALRGVGRSFGEGKYSVHALEGIDLDVAEGEFIAVMGPSGSGKSTLLAVIGGLDVQFTGEVEVLSTPLRGLGREELAALRRRSLGFVFQDYNLVPTLTARENAALPLELDGVPSRAAQAEADRALERVGLSGLGGRFLEELSGGQRQRVAIARAIVGDRQLLLADEPTGALDSRTGDEIMAVLRDLADEGMVVLLVTHEARHAGWADRIVFLRDGRIVDQMSSDSQPERLLPQPEDEDDDRQS